MPASQQLLDNLQTIGFSPNEAEVYIALIRLSPSFVAPLVKETKKHRQMVYNALDSLLNRNLIVRSTKNGKFYYELANPDRLVQIIKEQETVAADLASQISDQISQPDEQVEVLRGSTSFQEALLAFTAIGRQNREYIIMNTIPREFVSFTASKLKQQITVLRQLKKEGMDIQLLAFKSIESQLRADSFWPYVDDPYETRVSDSTPEPPQTIWISGEHVYLRNHLDDPILIHIKSKDLAGRYREYFNSYWQSATPVHRLG